MKKNMKIASILLTLLLFSNAVMSKTADVKQVINKSTIQNNKIMFLNDSQLRSYILDKKVEYPFFEMGTSYLNGKLIDVDYKKAAYWLKESSETEKNKKADFLLGELYMDGVLTNNKSDYKKAEAFYKKSALNGNQDAELKLAINFLYNQKMIDKNTGYSLIENLSKKGNKEALLMKSLLMTDNKGAKNLLIFKDYLEEKIKNKDSDSSFILGYLYFSGKGVQSDFKKALYYFNISSKDGCLMSNIISKQITEFIEHEGLEKKI